jgi:hypothetical protein
MCHADQNWTEALPLVLLGIRTSFKGDLQASVAELVYGEPLRIPGELLTPTADPVDPALLITEFCQHMAPPQAGSSSTPRHPTPATFVHSELGKCTHIFLHQDTTRRALEPPYRVLSRREKTLQLLVRGRPVTVSADRVKPAYILGGIAGTAALTSQPTQPRPYHRLPHHQCLSNALQARAATSISLLASTSEQSSPWGGGGDVGAFHSATGAIESALKYVSPDTH